jgi:CheY-like chemotaxis protein
MREVFDPPLLRGATVLLAEDDDDSRELLVFALESSGANVIAAASAREALGRVPDVIPSVLVTDISMPGEDGYWLLAEVRKTLGARGVQIPAIACTALAREHTRDAVIAAGFQDYVTKPIDPIALCTVVARAMEAPASGA